MIPIIESVRVGGNKTSSASDNNMSGTNVSANNTSATSVSDTRKHGKKRKMDALDELLDKLTDPEKKAKKRAKKEKKIEEKQEQAIESDKLYAKDCFNVVPTPEELTLWVACTTNTLSNIEDLKKWLSEAVSYEMIGYTRLEDLSGLNCILDFWGAAEHCKAFLEDKQNLLGWKINATGYDPVAVSSSTPELLVATFECYKMMIKQKMVLLTILQRPKQK